jgi:hypothetical protein
MGYIVARDFTLDIRSPDGQADRLPGFAAELVKVNVDLILAVTDRAATAAKSATPNYPDRFYDR